jgi:hypothetical protein
MLLTPEAIRLGVSGLAVGSLAGLAWRASGRTRWGAAPFIVAAVLAAVLTGRFDRPRWSVPVAGGAVVTLVGGAGATRLLSEPSTDWRWVAVGAVVSLTGVWVGVPETGPAVLTAGLLVGLTLTAAVTDARWAPSSALGLCLLFGWAALSGAAGRPWATVGGALCTGLAPWLSFPVARFRGDPPSGRWLLAAHMLVVLAAARWIAVRPDAGWLRVTMVALVGAAATRRPR